MLRDFPVVVQFPLQWGDMDAFQHVNNAHYFRYFEDARIVYFEKCFFTSNFEDSLIGPILKSTSCIFRLPLTYPDTIFVGAKVTSVSEDRFSMAYAIFSHRHQKIAAEGEGVVVCFDYKNNSKTALPERVKDGIKKLEASIKHDQ